METKKTSLAVPVAPGLDRRRSSCPLTFKELEDIGGEFGFPQHIVREFYSAFIMFDKDGNGTITWSELGAVMQSIGTKVSDAQLQNIVKEADADGNEGIEFPEFVAMIANKLATRTWDDILKSIFNVLDRDNDGFVSHVELRFVILNLNEDFTDQEIKDMIHNADADGDGKLNFKEFVKMMTV